MEAPCGHRYHRLRILRSLDAVAAAVQCAGRGRSVARGSHAHLWWQPANAENGGSALTVLQLTRKPDAAYRFVDFVAHDAQGISARVDGGAFPADYATLNSADFLDKTTITNDRGIEIPYFGGQKFNRVLSEAAEDVSVGYQYLPFEVYARSDFKSTVGQAYECPAVSTLSAATGSH